jgi:hypothetical protein
MDTKIYDFTQRGKDKGVKLIVRPHNNYGGAPAGATVLVDEEELKDASTMSACMTPDDAAEMHRKAVAAAEAEAERRARGSVSGIKAVVESGLAALTERSIRDAKRRAEEADAQAEAVKDAADAVELAEKADAQLGNAPIQNFAKRRKGR